MLGNDGLSLILQRLRLQAEVYVHADFCGSWVVDTSGSRKVPFHLVESGTSWLHLPGESPRLLTAGDLVIFPHDQEHQLCNQEQLPEGVPRNEIPEHNSELPSTTLACGSFEFASRNVWPLLDGLPEVIILDLTDTQRFGQTHALMQLMIGELQRRDAGCKAVVDQLAAALFIHVLRSQLAVGLSQGILAALFDPQIGQVLTLMHQHPAEEWSVELLAKKVGMSRSLFSVRFRTLAGKTPMRYLAEWRMQEARDLLMNTDRSIGVIAETCGYQSEVAFRKAFRAITGQTPGSVRKSR